MARLVSLLVLLGLVAVSSPPVAHAIVLNDSSACDPPGMSLNAEPRNVLQEPLTWEEEGKGRVVFVPTLPAGHIDREDPSTYVYDGVLLWDGICKIIDDIGDCVDDANPEGCNPRP